MKSKLINIRYSKRNCLPSSMIKQCKFEEKVNLIINDDSTIISKPIKPREGWTKAFIDAGAGNEENIFNNINNNFDEDEWTW